MFAFDSRSRRVTSFSLNGDLIETTGLRSPSIGRPLSVIRQDDGTYLSQSPWVDPSGQDTGPQDMRLDLDSIAIVHLDAAAALIDTVRVLADRTRARRVQDRGGGILATQQANTPYSALAFMRSDGVRVIVAHSGVFELDLPGPAGEAQTVLRVLGVQHPATADEIRARQEATIREELGDGEIDPAVWLLNIEFLPDRLPAFAAIVISDGGDVWVALTEYDGSGGYDWLVFTRARSSAAWSTHRPTCSSSRSAATSSSEWCSTSSMFLMCVGIRFSQVVIRVVVESL